MESEKAQVKYSKVPLVLGIISIFAWLIALVGLIVSIIGIILSIKEIKKGSSKVALILNCIGLIASIINGVLGFSLAMNMLK